MDMKSYNLDGHKLIYHLERLNRFVEHSDCYPLYMEVSPVATCNHRCKFCAYDFIGHPNRKLEKERTIALLEELKAAGLKSLLYSGEGEPLLHPDIDEFVIHAKNIGIDVGMYTNGHFLSKDLAGKIMPSLTFVRFSFSGGSDKNYAEVHNVKAGIFDRVVENITAASEVKKEHGLDIDIGVQFVLIPENIKYLIDAVKIMKESIIDYFVIKPFVQQSEQQFFQQTERLRMEDLEGLFDKAESLSDQNFKVIARRDSFRDYGRRSYDRCYGTSFISVLNSAGDISTCLPYWDKEEFCFGNIYSNTFKEIWLGKRRTKIKEYLEHTMNAQECPPNCRPNAINEFLWEVMNPTFKHINFI